MDILFTIIGFIGFIEVSFLQGLFTGPIVLFSCIVTGIISVIYKIMKKDYHVAVLYALLFGTIVFGYLNIM